MTVLETLAFVVLASAFLARVARAVKHREARLTCIGTGAGALATLTLGTIVPQGILDAPLGGHNLLKLVQTSLALIAVWLGAQAALSLHPAGHRMHWYSLVTLVTAPAIAFLFIDRREPTNIHFLDDNMHQFATWLYVVLYLVALVYVAARLIIAFGGHRRIGAWLIKIGAAAIILASASEILTVTLQLTAPADKNAIAQTSPVFPLAFYPGVCAMTCGIIAYTTGRTIRGWRIPRLIRRLEVAVSRAAVPEPSPVLGTGLDELYLATIRTRDLVVAGQLHLSHGELSALRHAERIVSRNLTDPLHEGKPTITTYAAHPTP